jgi:hypothetical protein
MFMRKNVIAGFMSVVLLSARILSGAPDETVVQGLYEGTCKDAKGEMKLEVRVVAQGNGTYKVLARQMAGDGKVCRVELSGATEGESVSFKGKDGDIEWKGSYAGDSITGTCGEGCKLDIKRVERLSPTVGKKPPQVRLCFLTETCDGGDGAGKGWSGMGIHRRVCNW